MMDKQSETFEGRLSTLNDAYTLMIRNISDGALPVLKEQIIEVTKLVEKTDATRIALSRPEKQRCFCEQLQCFEFIRQRQNF